MDLSTLFEKARQLVQAQADRNPEAAQYWLELDQAIATTSTHQEAIAAFGREKFFDLLALVGLGHAPADAIVRLQTATPDEITDTLNAEAAGLEEDTAARKKRNEELADLGLQLGQQAARILLPILIALV